MKKTAKYLIAYIAGNIVQIILNALAKNTYMMHPIWFCIAAGFLVLAAIMGGVILSNSEKETVKKKSYADYAKIPGEEE